jgi:RND superfamily putative drug exporter
MSERLALALRKLRWPVVAVWLTALIAAGIAAAPLPDRLSGGGWYVPGSESQQVADALRSGFSGRGASNVTLVVRDERHTAPSPQFADRVDRVMREVSDEARLEATGTYGWLDASPAAQGRFVGKDKRTAITVLGLRLDDGAARRVLPTVQQDVERRYRADGLRVAFVSAGSFWGEINKLSEAGLRTAELITFPLILIILLVLYRGVAAALVSFVVGGTAIVLAFGVLSLVAQRYELSIFVQNAATMIGLGVSVDYALFMISRYTEELARASGRVAALATTLRTSGETVAFSGAIVIVATSSLFLIDLNVIHSVALGVIVVVAFAVLSSVLVLPAVLYLLGDRIAWGALPWQRKDAAAVGRRWQGAARRIMARPVMFLAVSVVGLVALAVPALQMRTFTPDARIVPTASPVRFGFDAVNTQFGQGSAAPIQVVLSTDRPLTEPDVADRLVALHDRLAGLGHVTRVESAVGTLRALKPGRPLDLLASKLPTDAQRSVDHFVSENRRAAVLEVVGDDHASSENSRALLESVRAVARESGDETTRAAVGGETAEGVDANEVIAGGLPAVVIVMLAVIYLLLLLTFRSVFLPVKAIAMNLLSIGATYGVLVLVFQYGFGADLFGYAQFGYLQNFVPVLLLAILFSLSTDYEVFLLNRIREEHDAGLDNTASVAAGMARTAPLISGAAALMVAVFGAFAFTGILPIQQLGFGLALAIALDATLIRLVVVPASMRLMGRWNWWLPGRRARPAPSAVEEPAPAFSKR